MKSIIAGALISLFLTSAHAQETPPPGAPPPAPESAPSDTGEFNKDLDDFEKNMAKEVPPPKEKPAGVPGLKKETNTEKARATMKKQLAEGGKKDQKPAKKAAADKKSKKVKKASPRKGKVADKKKTAK